MRETGDSISLGLINYLEEFNVFLRSRWNELLALFVIACASLIFELTTTKIFEYSLWANYAYLVISTAMFGLGMSGILLTRWHALLMIRDTRFLPWASVGAALAFGIGFLLTNYVPIHLPDAPLGWGREMLNVGCVFLGLALPFTFVGLIISYLFEYRGRTENVYYFADLIGGRTGMFHHRSAYTRSRTPRVGSVNSTAGVNFDLSIHAESEWGIETNKIYHECHRCSINFSDGMGNPADC